jgi:hypothetical protein
MKTLYGIRFSACVGIVLALLGPVSASADFRVEGEQAPAQQAAAIMSAPTAPGIAIPASSVNTLFGADAKRAALTQIGAPSKSPSTVHGFGRDVTLKMAVTQIVPEGWRGKTSGNVDPSRTVSWKGEGRTWVAVLEDIASQADVVAQVNWNAQEITFYALNEYDAMTGHADSARPKVWTLKAGKSLQENLQEWAHQAGWKLVWRPDFKFMISANVSLTGPFDGDDGVVAQVTNAYRHSENPIIPEFYLANHVVEIREMKNNVR